MIELVEDGLAVARITRLITTDRLTMKLRDKITARWGLEWIPDKTQPGASQGRPNSLGYLLTCDWCVSMYVAAGVAVARTVAPRAWRPLARALASSATAGIIASYT